MNTFFECLFVFAILLAFSRFSWAFYYFLGTRFSKKLATTVDFITSTFISGWLLMNDHPILAGIVFVSLIQQNFNKEFQQKLSDALDVERKKYLDNKEST